MLLVTAREVQPYGDPCEVICQGLNVPCGNGQSQCDSNNLCKGLHWMENDKETPGNLILQPFCHEARDVKKKCAGEKPLTCAEARDYITTHPKKGDVKMDSRHIKNNPTNKADRRPIESVGYVKQPPPSVPSKRDVSSHTNPSTANKLYASSKKTVKSSKKFPIPGREPVSSIREESSWIFYPRTVDKEELQEVSRLETHVSPIRRGSSIDFSPTPETSESQEARREQPPRRHVSTIGRGETSSIVYPPTQVAEANSRGHPTDIDMEKVAEYIRVDMLRDTYTKAARIITMHDHVWIVPGRRGIRNVRNSCWANSIMQALGHLMPLRQAIHESLLRRAVRQSAMYELMTVIDEEMMSVTNFESIDLTELFRRLGQESPDRFDPRYPGDITDFLDFVMDQLYLLGRDDIIRPMFALPSYYEVITDPDTGREVPTDVPGGTNTFIYSLILQCPSHDPPDLTPLEECFTNTFQESLNRRTVYGSALYPDARFLGPQILIIRTEWIHRDTLLEIPLVFDISQQLGFENIDGTYSLQSIIHTHDQQHYTANFLDPLFHEWLHANDRSVQRITDTDGMRLSDTVFALVYQRQGE